MSSRRFGLWVGLLSLVSLFAAPVSLYSQDALPPRRTSLRADARERASIRDTLLEFSTRRLSRGRVDVNDGVLRAAYRIRSGRPGSAGPVDAARRYLQQNSTLYGLEEDLNQLQLATVHETAHSSHVLFQQTYEGVPVLERQIKVSLDRESRPSMALSSFAVHLSDARALGVAPSVGADAARTFAQSLFREPLNLSEPSLFVHASKKPRLVWRFIGWPTMTGGEWEVLIDAHSGEMVRLMDQVVEHGGKTGDAGEGPGERTGREWAGAMRTDPGVGGFLAPAQSASVDGGGLVFDPDPLATAGVEYGGRYVDADDADVFELNAQRVEVVLPEISLGTDGLYRLQGPYVRIVGSGVGPQTYTPPAEIDPTGFRYTRADDRFEAVMAYYHVDASQRRVETLDAGTAAPRSVRVNPHAQSKDEAFYYPSLHAIAFGTGGVDDAEDASILWHEHGHAILNNTSPGLLSTSEGQSLHEGWSDYWAASRMRHDVESGAIPPRDWRDLYPWDGSNPPVWCGRYLAHDGRYPDQIQAPPVSGCGTLDERYARGILWATTMMEVYTDLGREVTDRLNLASHAYLSAPATLADAAEAVIQADLDLYGGIHTGVLVERLSARGFVDAEDYGPVLIHEPLRNTEQLGGTVRLEVLAHESAAAVDSVIVYFGTSPVPVERLVLDDFENGLYAAELPLPEQPDTLRYYIEAVDELNRRSRLPAGGPSTFFTVITGPDRTPPEIIHTPIAHSSLAAWPAQVVADVRDQIGVDTVWVKYTLLNAEGSVNSEGAFGLESDGTLYRSDFPIGLVDLSDGSRILYAIHARDAAVAANEATLPSGAPFEFRVIAKGLLRSYDFEGLTDAIVSTGVWRPGTPTYGVRTAHSGVGVWATNPSGPYPDFAQRSTLDLPAINLRALGQTYLVFWHWYDFEHNGNAEPGIMKQIPLWDGGNVKVSTDGGSTWGLLTPERGYSGVIDQTLDNPLGGEEAFGGYSYGWRQVVMQLPAASDVRVRFDFGTDISNEDSSIAYAGWYVDDIAITTDLTLDEVAPVVVSAPAREIVRGTGQTSPPLRLRVTDDTGIDAAEVLYVWYPVTGTATEGSFRLAMSDTSLWEYSGTVSLPGERVAGDRLDYRIRIQDFAGNMTWYPAPGTGSASIEYRNLNRITLFDAPRPSGAWSRKETVWQTTPGTAEPRSSLVLDRVDLPRNAEDVILELEHRYILEAGAGANVKITADGGATWVVLSPTTQYPEIFSVAPGHPMAGEAVFNGALGAPSVTRFDLSSYAGQQVQLRLDLGLVRPLRAGEVWAVSDAAIVSSSTNATLDVPRALALHPNFPDPFSGTTALSYTIAETAMVRIEVFDVLGRRVDLLVAEEQVAGSYSTLYDASRLASGMYLVRMIVGREQRTERIYVTR